MKPSRLNNRVKLARIEKGLNQAQLAERAGVTRQTIGLIEAGGYNPTLKLCIELARATGKTLDDLFWNTGDH
ncbi:MAG: helix-turn-helix transcriptional regulator [Lysobacterales bacterium]|jgi:putative transcriptional regulator